MRIQDKSQQGSARSLATDDDDEWFFHKFQFFLNVCFWPKAEVPERQNLSFSSLFKKVAFRPEADIEQKGPAQYRGALTFTLTRDIQ